MQSIPSHHVNMFWNKHGSGEVERYSIKPPPELLVIERQEVPNISADKDCTSLFPKEKLTLKGDRSLDLDQGSNLSSSFENHQSLFEVMQMFTYSCASADARRPSLCCLCVNSANFSGLQGTTELLALLLPQVHQDFK